MTGLREEPSAERIRLLVALDRLRIATQAAKIGIWDWDVAKDELVWDDAMYALYGARREDFSGAFDAWSRTLAPGDFERATSMVEAALRGDAEFDTEFRVVWPDGSVHHIGATAEVVRNDAGAPLRMVGVNYDITESRLAEEETRRADQILVAVRQAAERLLAAGSWQDAIDDVLTQLAGATRASRLTLYENREGDGGTLFMVPRFGWSAPEIGPVRSGRPDESFILLDEWRELLAAGDVVNQTRATMSPTVREKVRRSDLRSLLLVPVTVSSQWRWELAFDDFVTERLWDAKEVDALRAAAGVLAAAMERELVEQELAERQEELQQAQKMEAIGQLAGGVAHDFNNLLTVIGGNVELALQAPDGSVVREELLEIARASERAAELVRQLLAFSRADGSTPPQIIDVNESVEGVRRMLERVIAENITVHLELSDAQPRTWIDQGRLEQVLLNLAVNARDAMPYGGTITLRTHAEPERVAIEVSDTGTGMDERTQARIFDPFFTTKAAGEGTGLGLSTAYGIVKTAEGSIDVASTPGEGSIFTVKLPLAAADTPFAEEASQQLPARGIGERILLVEDDEMVRAVGTELLTKAGYAVSTAANGRAALRLVEASADPFDLIFTDVMMPEMTGIELVRELRSGGNTTPVLYTSGHAQTLASAGADEDDGALLAKPFTAGTLCAAVAAALGRG